MLTAQVGIFQHKGQYHEFPNQNKNSSFYAHSRVFGGVTPRRSCLPDELSAVYNGTHSILGTSSPVVHLGKIPLFGTTRKEVKIFNFHTQPITISQVGASCGCTAAESRTAVIRPFTFGVVSVSVSPSRMGAGKESITLQTNVGGQNIPVSFTAVQH